MSKNSVRRGLVGMGVGAVVAASIISPPANADVYDPHIPIPILSWCPGGGIGTGLAGYCEGQSYPDGTRWNIAYGWAPFVGRINQPMRCVIFTGDPNPPLAGPGGCGGAV